MDLSEINESFFNLSIEETNPINNTLFNLSKEKSSNEVMLTD